MEGTGWHEEVHVARLPQVPAAETADLAGELRARAAGTEAFTVGVEEEYLLVATEGPGTADVADRVVARAAGDPRVRRELPPCQVEMATPPRTSLDQIEADLCAARRAVAVWCDGIARPLAAAVHPTVSSFDGAASSRRSAELLGRYGQCARRQVVGALQVHVALGDADRLLAVHDALRAYLPHLAGLAAAAPFADGRDTGLASARPMVATWLPRQGIPPALRTWDRYAAELGWMLGAGCATDPTHWWWELRPHPLHGTLEVRVADGQATVDDAMGVVELVLALVRWLTDRADHDDLPAPSPSWRIDENRWSALRSGLEGTFADLRRPTSRWARDEVADLIDAVRPWSQHGLVRTERLLDDPPHRRLRAAGVLGSIELLAAAFPPPQPTSTAIQDDEGPGHR